MRDAQVAAKPVPAEYRHAAARLADGMARLAAHIAAEKAAEQEGQDKADRDCGDETALKAGRRAAGDLPGEWQCGCGEDDGGEAHQRVHDRVEGGCDVEMRFETLGCLKTDIGDLET